MGAFDDLAKTNNLKLNKPTYGNVADIEALNENFDIIDKTLSYPGTITFYVDANVSASGDGYSAETAFKSIQEAIDAVPKVSNRALINVASGTYSEVVRVIGSTHDKLSIVGAANNKPVITAITAQGMTHLSITNCKIVGMRNDTDKRALDLSYCNAFLSNVECENVTGNADSGLMLHATNGFVSNCSIKGYKYGLSTLYGGNVEVVNYTALNNTYDLNADGSIIHIADDKELSLVTTNGGAIISAAVGQALTKDLYAILINENTFRNKVLAIAMSNVISTLFMEVFADTNDINKNLGDAATAIEKYYIARGHIWEKTDSGTITLYTNSKSVNTGNNKVWVYADYTSKGGSVELAISRDGGSNYTVVSNNVLTDITSKPSGTSMSLRIKITGAVTLRNVAWGCK